jgi:CheY-like chemotaxis protein
MEDKNIASRKILVVDDESYVCEALKLMLSVDGHEVVTASSAAQALPLIHEGHFDLLITDYSMPVMKGDELARIVKRRNPNLPIIMVTAYVEKLTGEGSPLLHVDKLLGKPFRFEDLKTAMAQVL